MVNTNMLKAKYMLKGLTQEEVADKIGINPSTLSLKQNNEPGYVFSIAEVEKLAKVLNISKRELTAIFFA